MTPLLQRAHLGVGEVRHARLRPVRNAFRYPSFFLMLPMRAWRADPGAVPRNRWAPLAFHDRDHGAGGPDALAWLDDLLAQSGIEDAQGEVLLQCYPRVFGFVFKPVSFWYCHRADGTLRAIVAEVNNTFGERHCYLLDAPQWGRSMCAAKVFHVSPFCEVRGEYRFRFLVSGKHGRSVARIDYDDGAGVLLQTSLSGELREATPQALRDVLWQQPLMTVALVFHIHAQALRLWWRGVRFVRKPAPPAAFLTR